MISTLPSIFCGLTHTVGIRYICSTSIGSTNGSTATSSAVNTLGAGLIVLSSSGYTTGGPTVSDSLSNTWIGLTVNASTNQSNKIYYCINPKVGASHTFSVASSFPSLSMVGFAGIFSLDQQSGSNSATSSITSGPITPTQTNELIIAGIGSNQQSLSSIGSTFVLVSQVAGVDSVCQGSSIAYLIQTSLKPISAVWTNSGASQLAATIASFK